MDKWARALYQPGLPLGEDGRRVTASERHIALSKDAAKEGMVLLKNENQVLPLACGIKAALFGKASFDYVKGGGGSGDVTVPYTRNLYEGFQELNRRQGEQFINIYEPLADFYRGHVAAERENGIAPGKVSEPALPDDLLQGAKRSADTAIICICRFSGEGADRTQEDFSLTAEERTLVHTVTASFDRVIAVLNVGGVVETAWFRADPRIQGALLTWQGGIEGGLAAAELLCGIGNPSGRLADTFADSIADYPSTASFLESDDYVEYREGIFVGYRYFETGSEAKHLVSYPFGYGLSYTTFESTCTGVHADEQGTLLFYVRVTNTGTVPGKEVVQLYAQCPQGFLEKPARVLLDFAKTPNLAPGASCSLCLVATAKNMSSYDEDGAVAASSWVLEEGDYHFYLGANVRDAKKVSADRFDLPKKETAGTMDFGWFLSNGACRLGANRVVETCTRQMSYRREEMPAAGEALPALSWEEMECMVPAVRAVPRRCFLLKKNRNENQLIRVADESDPLTLDAFVAALPDEALANLLGGQPNTGVANTYGIGNLPEYGVPNIMTADGPAGLRIEPHCGVTTTAWPCATMLACTWNPALAEQVGKAAAEEVKENNIGIWLAPAVNIHRNPLCGRNFEYYSEDPLLAGKIGAGMVRGIQSMKIAATVKHFALNNKEQNRKESDSRASERAIREIYLKVFEIIVKEAKPWAIMSSYNRINGKRSSERSDLLTEILRGEWGYEGVVMTDWWTFSEEYKEILAGNDVKMGCGYPERLLEAKRQGLINRADLERSAKRVLELILKID